MRMLDLDVDDMKELSEITEKEALEFLEIGEQIVCRTNNLFTYFEKFKCFFLEIGEQIVCRTNSRDFRELSKVEELQRLSKLKEEGIYNHLEFYVK